MADINKRFTHVMGDGACTICRHIDTAVETGKAHCSDTAMFIKFVELNGFTTKDPSEIRRFSKKILLDHWFSMNPQPNVFKAERELAYKQKVWREFEAKLKEADEGRRYGQYSRWQATYDALLSRAGMFQRDVDNAEKYLERVKAKKEEAPKPPHSLLALFGVTTDELRPAPVIIPQPIRREEWKPECTLESLFLQYKGEPDSFVETLFLLRTMRPPRVKLRHKFISKAKKLGTYEDKEFLVRSYKEARIEHQRSVFGDRFSLAKAAASVDISVDW